MHPSDADPIPMHPSSGDTPRTQGRPVPNPAAQARTAQVRRLRLLKRLSAFGSVAAFGTLMGLAALHPYGITSHRSREASSATSAVSGTDSSSGSGSFFQGGGNQGGNSAYAFGSSSASQTAQAPAAVTSVS